MVFARRIVPANSPARRDLLLSIVLGSAAGALLVLQAALFGWIVAAVFLAGRTLREVAAPLAALAGVALARAACSWAGDTSAAGAAIATKATLRGLVMRAILARDPGALDGERTGELTNTLVGGIEALDAYVRAYLPQLALAVLVPLIIGAAVLVIDPLSALVLGLTWPLIPLFMSLIGAHAREQTRKQWLTLSRMSARFLEALQGLVTLKAFGRSRAEADVIAASGEGFRSLTMSVLRVAFVSALVLELLATISTAIVAVEVGLRLLYGRIGLGSALTVLVLAPEFYRPLRALGAAFHAGMAGRESGQRVLDLLAHLGQPASPSGARAVAGGAAVRHRHTEAAAARDSDTAGSREQPSPAAPPARIDIAFEHVRYAYAGRAEPALDDVTFDVKSGQTLALVGPSGSGKSTVARVLLRFAEPEGGQVWIRPARAGTLETTPQLLRALPAEHWRRFVAWVPQRPHLFYGTIRDNVGLARPMATDAEIWLALQLAHADGFVMDLADGLQTQVGEAGARLSGGQAQRIALARAFLKGAPVVVLDEPTAQLDPGSQRQVSDAIGRLRADRTVLIIAHRLATVVDADRIVMLDRGRVVDSGTHTTLMSTGGPYARYVTASRSPA